MSYALLSVSNKEGIIDFAKSLVDLGYDIISTGGTFRALQEAGIEVTPVSDVTQFEEIMNGRVKTLHPKIHGGILADRHNDEHVQAMDKHHITPIDIVAVNLYPFEETVAKEGVTEMDAIENIDIGGPTMLRSAAKNFKHVLTIVDPSDYDEAIERLKSGDDMDAYRKEKMIKVFNHTYHYDQAIVEFFSGAKASLRYGENPHQQAHLVRTNATPNTILGAVQHHGKPLSYNNIKDADAALNLVKQFDSPTAVAVKHMNPCGVGVGDSIEEAYDRAYAADSMSIFGGIVALNRPVTKTLAEKLHEIFLEVIIAPSFDDEAIEILSQKKNIRLLEVKMDVDEDATEFVSVSGGYLTQDVDQAFARREDMQVVTDKQPTKAQWEAALLGLKVVKSVKSNAILLSSPTQTVGIGAGQMNRVGALKIAIERATELNENIALASDGFFPMRDTVDLAAEHGIKCIIQPGGSIKDQQSIDACNEHGIAMITTGMRHFKH